MAARSLRSWLKAEPHPVRIRATDAEGETHGVRIGESKSKWRDAEKALQGFVRCEALNAENEILRVWEDDEAIAQIAPTGAPAPEGNGMQIVEIARLLQESADAAALRHAEAYRLAYEQQSLLVRVLSERLQTLERAWHRLIMSQGQAEQPDPNDPTKLNETMILALLGNVMNQQSQKSTNGG